MSGQSASAFDPLWRRLAIIAVCAGWTVLEWMNGQTAWALLATAATVYGAWSLLIAWTSPAEEPVASGERRGEGE